jgi:dCMP deaminase
MTKNSGLDGVYSKKIEKWDQRFLDLAKLVGTWSKDPSTRVGAAIIRPDRTVASVGYNGLPRGVADTNQRLIDRPTKYALTVHAEVNALIAAHQVVNGCTIYVDPFPPCSSCAAALIQAGIVRIVAPDATDEQKERWGDSFTRASMILSEANVELVLV